MITCESDFTNCEEDEVTLFAGDKVSLLAICGDRFLVLNQNQKSYGFVPISEIRSIFYTNRTDQG